MREGEDEREPLHRLWDRPNDRGAVVLSARPTSFGNYPDIQKVWDQFQKAVDLKERKELILQAQKMMYDRTMFIPLIASNAPTALGPG